MEVCTLGGMGIAAVFGVVLGCGATGCVQPELPAPSTETVAPAAPPVLPDARVAAAVERELTEELGDAADRIAVAVAGGIVELTGRAPHLLAAERAALVAESIRGVRAVSNRVIVVALDRPDADIEDDIERALQLDPALDATRIRVSVTEQRVSLHGTVGSWTEQQLAARAAKRIKGVEAVDDDLRIVYDGERSDDEIAADVRARLAWDTLVNDGVIEVEVDRGTVELQGSVATAAQKRRAVALSWVAGVRDVEDSGLRVSWTPEGDDMIRDEHVDREPGEIVAALEAAMSRDPRVASYDVVPVVSDDRVTLHGTVGTLHAKRAAEQIALHTTGVVSVVNRIRVEPPPGTSDREVEHNLRWALFANPITESREIAVDVQQGHATLRGTVETETERAEAEDMARGTLGVRSVTNALRVAAPGKPFVYDPYTYRDNPYVESWSTFVPW